jgi:hypothetical protein
VGSKRGRRGRGRREKGEGRERGLRWVRGVGEKALQPLRHEFKPHNIKNRDLTSK